MATVGDVLREVLPSGIVCLAGQAAEVVEQPKDDQAAAEPSENLSSEGSEVEAPKVE